jgi:hypothetical protein
MSDQMPAELSRIIQDLRARLDAMETRGKKVPAVPVTKASGQFNLPQVDTIHPPGGTVSIYSEDGHLRIIEDDGDVISIPAADVSNPPSLTSSTVAGTPTKDDFNALRVDVSNVRTALINLLTSLRNSGQIGT